MIEKMKQMTVVVEESQKKQLLAAMYEAKVMHLRPVDPKKVQLGEKFLDQIAGCKKTRDLLAVISHNEGKQNLAADEGSFNVEEVVAEVLKLDAVKKERSRLRRALRRKLEQQACWGEIRGAVVDQIKSSGLVLRFFRAAENHLPEFNTKEAVFVNEKTKDGKLLVAVASLSELPELPSSWEEVYFPREDNEKLKERIAELDALDQTDQIRLLELSARAGDVALAADKLEQEGVMKKALLSGFGTESLFAVSGWVPESALKKAEEKLASVGIEAAIRFEEAAEDELPPTLLRFPCWAKPIKGLFEVLNTYPGYREADLSSFFMVWLPLFAAILIGDAGYGALLLFLSLLFRKTLLGALGRAQADLCSIIAAAALVFGVLSGNYFGITPVEIAQFGGFEKETGSAVTGDVQAMLAAQSSIAWLGQMMSAAALLWDEDPETVRNILIKLSFILGCFHLVLAHLVKFFALYPSSQAIAELGWTTLLATMLLVIWLMFFETLGPLPVSLIYFGLILGAILTLLFESPNPNPIKRVLFGLGASVMPWMGTFSDIMSYIRLMAVGLATYYIAASFNQIAGDVSASVGWLAAVPILFFGHGLNIALALVAIFAHGIRLNMLEFSNNAGVQWGGYKYSPFGSGNK